MSLLPDDEILALSVEEIGDLNNCDFLNVSEDVLITEGNNLLD